MDSIIRYFTWYIGDVDLWLPLDKYSMRSPTYSLGNSQCKFYLQFINDRKAEQVSVFVCPDGESKQAETFVSLVLKTVSGRIVGSSVFRAPFPKEVHEGLVVTVDQNTLLKHLEKEYDKDMVVVTCESTLLEPTFMFLNEGIKELSADLLKLRRDSHFVNAELIAGIESISVHKEIVCSRSPVLSGMLKDYNSCCLNFPAAVLKVMLDYLYSASFSLKELDTLCIQQLSACAVHYEVPDLAKMVAPRRTYITSLVHTETETHTLQFPNFRELCKNCCPVEHKIKMQFKEAVEMRVKLNFECYNKCGKISLETTFWNLVNVKNVSFRLLMFNWSNAFTVVDKVRLDVPSEEKLIFCKEYGSKSLFCKRISVLPNDVLVLKYEIKFQFNGQLHILDPDPISVSEGQSTSHETSLALVKNMESLMGSKLYADAFLVLPWRYDLLEAPRISVHKSILSARSPVFRTSQEVLVNLSEWAIKHLLHYAYTGVLLIAGPRILRELHTAAGNYGMDSLKRACEEAAAKMALNIKNVFSIYSIAGCGEMRKDFIARKKDLFLSSYRWEELITNETVHHEQLILLNCVF